MATLADMAEELAALVPAVSGAPTAAQYEQAVRDAVADFGRRCPQLLRGELAIVAGTAAYDLPAGFARLVRLESTSGDGLRDGAGYLIAPSLPGAVERHVISGGRITFYPTPAYTLNRGIWYAGGYPYDAGDDEFTGLTAEYERAALLKAQATVMRLLAGFTAGAGGLTYSIGDTSVQRALTSPYAGPAADLEKEYLEACKLLRGFVGRLSAGSYTP